MNQKDEKFERLFKEMAREFMSKGFGRFSDDRRQKNPGFDDLFDWFDDFREKMRNTDKEGTIIIEDEENDESVKDLEIKYLKDQVRQLKQQLKDKEELIELLKSKAPKTTKKKKS